MKTKKIAFILIPPNYEWGDVSIRGAFTVKDPRQQDSHKSIIHWRIAEGSHTSINVFKWILRYVPIFISSYDLEAYGKA